MCVFVHIIDGFSVDGVALLSLLLVKANIVYIHLLLARIEGSNGCTIVHACEGAAYRQVDEHIELLVEIVAWRCILTSVADVHAIIRVSSVVEIHVDDIGRPLQYKLVELAVLQARRRGSELSIVGIATILINTPVASAAI